MPKRAINYRKQREALEEIERFQIEVFTYFIQHASSFPPKNWKEKTTLRKIRKARWYIAMLERRQISREPREDVQEMMVKAVEESEALGIELFTVSDDVD